MCGTAATQEDTRQAVGVAGPLDQQRHHAPDQAQLPQGLFFGGGGDDRRCRSEATVFLCGHGGDEIMGGYRMDQDLFRLRLVHRASRMRLPVPASTIERYVNGYEPTSLKRSRLASANARPAPHAAR